MIRPAVFGRIAGILLTLILVVSNAGPRIRIEGDPSGLVVRVLTQQFILAQIYRYNVEGRWFREKRNESIRLIPKARALDLSVLLLRLEEMDRPFFWRVFMPAACGGSGFFNGPNDTTQPRTRRTWGYMELQVGTARFVAEKHKKTQTFGIPEDLKAAEEWLVKNWRQNVILGYLHLRYLWTQSFPGNDLLALNAYQAGITATKKGIRVVGSNTLTIRGSMIEFYKTLTLAEERLGEI